MACRIATADSTAVLWRRTVMRAAAAVLPALALSLALPLGAVAQETQGTGNSHFTPALQGEGGSNKHFTPAQQDQGSGSKHFTAAPVPKPDEEEATDSIEAAIGIPTNALFLIVVTVIGLYWFTIGGGRRAKKLGRQE